MDKILEYAECINKINSNEYFKKLKTNPELKSFGDSQLTFIKAVEMWSTGLSLLLTKLTKIEDKIVIVENLYDEMGNGDINNCHVNTFNNMLNLVRNNDKNISDLGVKKFNEEIINTLNNEDLVISVSMLGMVEYTYITVSKNINDYLSIYFPQEKIPHYTIHETLDIKHSLDLFKIVENNDLSKIKIGIEKGYRIMDELYSSLAIYL